LSQSDFNPVRFINRSSSPASMADADTTDWKNAKSIYEFTVKDIDGNEVSLEKYKGHVCIILNGACNCGFTDSNYSQLQTMYDELADSKGLRILVFPSNQFGGQEPWPNDKIKTHLIEKFNVKFDLFAKIEVNGSNADPLWNYLKMKQGGTLVDFIKWNFTKFLIDKDGQPVKRYAPTTSPKAIEKDLADYW
jgi:phospholipid-hydroperoxide glutathione peroxidase